MSSFIPLSCVKPFKLFILTAERPFNFRFTRASHYKSVETLKTAAHKNVGIYADVKIKYSWWQTCIIRNTPELLLRGGGVERILQLGLQRLQLFSQVSAVFLGFGPSRSLQLQILLKFTQLSLQLTDLLMRQILLSRFLLDPDETQSLMSWNPSFRRISGTRLWLDAVCLSPGQCLLKLLLLLGELRAEFSDLSLQLCDLIVKLCRVALQLPAVLLHLLSLLLLTPQTVWQMKMGNISLARLDFLYSDSLH